MRRDHLLLSGVVMNLSNAKIECVWTKTRKGVDKQVYTIQVGTRMFAQVVQAERYVVWKERVKNEQGQSHYVYCDGATSKVLDKAVEIYSGLKQNGTV